MTITINVSDGRNEYSHEGSAPGCRRVLFNGVSNPGAIRIPNTAAMQFTTGATIDLWARIDSGTGMSGATQQAATSGWAMALVAKSHDNGSVSLNAFPPDPNYSGTGYGFGAWASAVPGWGTGRALSSIATQATRLVRGSG